eukprot:6201023-Pleurochrysis_carterae.AAC.1
MHRKSHGRLDVKQINTVTNALRAYHFRLQNASKPSCEIRDITQMETTFPAFSPSNTKQPLKGRARFESVARTDSFKHARLSCRGVLYLSDSLRNRDLPRVSTIRAGGKRLIHTITISRGREQARARGRLGRAYTRWYEKGGSTGQRRPSRARVISKNLGSGARALRKYACDASPIWGTLHGVSNCK